MENEINSFRKFYIIVLRKRGLTGYFKRENTNKKLCGDLGIAFFRPLRGRWGLRFLAPLRGLGTCFFLAPCGDGSHWPAATWNRPLSRPVACFIYLYFSCDLFSVLLSAKKPPRRRHSRQRKIRFLVFKDRVLPFPFQSAGVRCGKDRVLINRFLFIFSVSAWNG